MTKKMKLMRKALSGVGLFMALTLHAQNEQPLYKDMNAPFMTESWIFFPE